MTCSRCVNTIRRLALRAITVSFVLQLIGSAALAAPTINKLSVRGLQQGGKTSLVIDGAELQPNPQIVLDALMDHPTIKPGATANHLEVEIALPADVPPGIYQLRIATSRGISSPAPIGIDALRQAVLADDAGELPVALTGAVSGSQSAKTSFKGKAGQSLVVDVEAKRIGSSLDPIVRLYDARRVQLAYSAGQDSMHGDCRLSAKLPSDGIYTVEVQHALFKAEANAYFRMKIGELQYADVAFPLAVKRGDKADVKVLMTNLPSDLQIAFSASGLNSLPLNVAASKLFTGTQPGVICGDNSEHVVPSSGKSSEATAPCGLSGVISKAGQEDRIPLTVKPGMKLKIDVLANRAGSPLDGVLTVRGDKGAQLATNDDRPGTCDPGLDFTVPANVKQIELGLKDMQGRGGADYFYHIAVTDLSEPNFSLSLSDDKIVVPAGGSSVLRIDATRQNYAGPIAIKFDGLPSGIEVQEPQIPAGANVALISLTGKSEPAIAKLISIQGKGAEAAANVIRPVLLPSNSATAAQSWLRREIGVALAEAAPLGIAWGELNSDQRLPIGAKLALPVKVNRTDNGKGPIRLSLVHSQQTPAKREEKAPAKPKPNAKTPPKPATEADRLLRLDGMPVIAADKNDGTATLLVPGDLPVAAYDLVLRAELLSADQKTAVATTFTPVLRLQAAGGFKLQLTSSPKIDAPAGTGKIGKFVGKIVRQDGFDAPVRVMLTGLPKGVMVPEVTVSADKSDFEFPVQFKYGTKAGELPDVHLVAASIEDDDPESVVHSAPVKVDIKVVRGEEPKVEKPLTIFEDEEKFLAALDEGKGVATLDNADKYSGKASIKVTPDERFTTDLPGLAVKIRENPAAGEYRYITFAWKKVGGEHLCLQINHDTDWGPVNGNPATFRYSAGPGEFFGGTLMIADKPSSEWTLITRDLFADFGEFTFNGIALSPHDGEYALFDHIYLGHAKEDFEQTPKPVKAEKK